MNKEELMVGDWIKVPLEDEDYNEVTFYRKVLTIGETSVMLDIGNYCQIGFEKLQPIPLTNELLKKNGYELYDSFATLDTTDYRFIYAYDGFITVVDNDNQRKISYLECNYVHEFQHLLKLIKYEKEIFM